MKTNIIVDIDGTCSNAEHRKHLIDGSQPKKDWDLFYDMCHLDVPHEDIRVLLQTMCIAGYTPHYFTGRVERVRDRTAKWLEQHGFPWSPTLLMRRDGDYTQDAVIKLDMANNCGLTPQNTLFAIDDRDQVVQMWRANGFRCLQVANGAF